MDVIAPKRQKLESLLEDKFPWRQSANTSLNESGSNSRESSSPPPENHPTLCSLLSAPAKAFSPGRPIASQVSRNDESMPFFAQCTACRVYIPDQDAFIQHVLLHYPNQFHLMKDFRNKASKSVKSRVSPTASCRSSDDRMKSKAPLMKRASASNIPSTSATNGPTSVLRSLLSNQNASTSQLPQSGKMQRSEEIQSRKEVCETCGEVFENTKNLTIHQKSHHKKSSAASVFAPDLLRKVVLKIEQGIELEEKELNVAALLPAPYASDTSTVTQKKLDELFEIYRSCKEDAHLAELKTPKLEF